MTTGDIVAVRHLACPASRIRTVVPVGDPVETQLRDVAILMMIGLLFVLTLQVLWLTSGRHDDDRDGA